VDLGHVALPIANVAACNGGRAARNGPAKLNSACLAFS
jgi:hypothetical protein